MDPVDPTVPVDSYYDAEALSKYPAKLRYHLWRNEMLGLPPEKHNVLRGSEEENNARTEAQNWLEGR